MERLKWIVIGVDGVVALACATIGFLWTIDVVHVSLLGPGEGDVSAFDGSALLRWTALLSSAWLILVNVVVLGARWFSSKYDTHVRCKTPNGEVSITVYALEETLARLVRRLPEVADITVTVRKELAETDKPVVIVASVKAFEGNSLKELTERVREVILHRYQEIIETHVKPQVEICVYKLIERAPRKDSGRKSPREDEIFRGPVYPVDAEERS